MNERAPCPVFGAKKLSNTFSSVRKDMRGEGETKSNAGEADGNSLQLQLLFIGKNISALGGLLKVFQ